MIRVQDVIVVEPLSCPGSVDGPSAQQKHAPVGSARPSMETRAEYMPAGAA
jgi:hypothetical protein